MKMVANSIQIVLVTAYYPAHGGGIERVAEEMTKALLETQGLGVTWVASDCDPAPASAMGLIVSPARSVNWVERWLALPWPVWAPGALLKLRRLVRCASVVHIHDHIYFGSMAAALLAILYRKPVVVTQHVGMIPYERGWMRWLLSRLNRTTGSWVLSRAETVVFESQVVKDYFSEFVNYRNAPELIANGVDDNLFKPASDADRCVGRAKLMSDSSRPLLLFVGRFVEKKGLPILQVLVSSFPDVEWVMLGSGPLDPFSWGAPNLRVHAPVPPAQLVSFYQAADLLVLPSKGEGFPLVVQEAMACGTPVIVGRETAGALPESSHVLHAEATESADAADRWVKAVGKILAQPQRLSQLRLDCAEHARRNWSWKRAAMQYRDLFKAAESKKRLR